MGSFLFPVFIEGQNRKGWKKIGAEIEIPARFKSNIL
jgi:hypothetical protein